MATITGLINCTFENESSKSEGTFTILTTSDGTKYTLYRKEHFPINDTFFYQFDTKKVVVEGEIEERNGYICVSSIREETNIES